MTTAQYFSGVSKQAAYTLVTAVCKALVIITTTPRLGVFADEAAIVMYIVVCNDKDRSTVYKDGDGKNVEETLQKQAPSSRTTCKLVAIKADDSGTDIVNGEEGTFEDEDGSRWEIVRHLRFVQTVWLH